MTGPSWLGAGSFASSTGGVLGPLVCLRPRGTILRRLLPASWPEQFPGIHFESGAKAGQGGHRQIGGHPFDALKERRGHVAQMRGLLLSPSPGVTEPPQVQGQARE